MAPIAPWCLQHCSLSLSYTVTGGLCTELVEYTSNTTNGVVKPIADVLLPRVSHYIQRFMCLPCTIYFMLAVYTIMCAVLHKLTVFAHSLMEIPGRGSVSPALSLPLTRLIQCHVAKNFASAWRWHWFFQLYFLTFFIHIV